MIARHGGDVMASYVDEVDGIVDEFRGLRFRRLKRGEALLFESGMFGLIDTAFVPEPIDVVWLLGATVPGDGVPMEVIRTATVKPWRVAYCPMTDWVLELNEGEANPIEQGDRIKFE